MRTLAPLRPLPLCAALIAAAPAVAAPAGASPVVVSTFQSSGSAVDRVAAELSAAVEREVARRPGLRLIPLEQVPAVSDVAALDYAQSCPPGEAVGCAFVVGEAGQAALAVAAIVRDGTYGPEVEVHVIDVPQSVDVLSFVAVLGPDDEVAFAEAVAAAVAAVAAGDVKAGGDIRAAVVDTSESAAEKLAAQQQLSSLNKELGGSDAVGERSGGRLVRKKYTMEDIAKGTETDGTTPWERINMSPQEYLRYKNADMSLVEWRERSAGRRGQLLLRPNLGFGRGPFDQTYRAYTGLSSEDLSVIQRDGWQATSDGSGFMSSINVDYGVLPGLQVGVGLGQAAGKYSLQVNRVKQGETREAPSDQVNTMNSLMVDVHVLGSFMQTSPVRPVAGGLVQLVRGTNVETQLSADQIAAEELPIFAPSALWQLGAIGGVEARMSDRLDLTLHVPLTVVVGGKAEEREASGGGAFAAGTVLEPPKLGGFGAAALVGVQVRLFKPRQPTARVNDDEPDF
jgi:hypothetical protein